MAARLPIPGSDYATWATILNTYLLVSHNNDGTLSPAALNQVAGNVYTASSNVQATSGDIVLGNCNGGNVTVTAPTPAPGAHFTVKKIDPTTNILIIRTPNNQTLDGNLSVNLSIQWASYTYISDGTNYYAI